MTEENLEWEEFVTLFQSQEIKPFVDVNKGHALMKSQYAPSNWRITIIVLTWVSVLAFPAAIVLFFFVQWWIPIIIIVTTIMLIKGIREESAKVVIETSLKNPAFYRIAIDSRTMKVYSI